MCIIAVVNSRRLTDSEIENSFSNNPDGAGIGWVDSKGRNNFIKGIMDLNEFKEIYKGVPKVPHVVHFRMSTSGGVQKELTHPMIVSEESNLYLEYRGEEPILFHNGIMARWEEELINYYIRTNKKIPGGHWSDTRLIAVMASSLGENFLSFKSMGKFALIMDGVIFTYGKYTKEDGVLFSSDTYKRIYTRYGSSYGYGTYGAGKIWRNGRWVEPDDAKKESEKTTKVEKETSIQEEINEYMEHQKLLDSFPEVEDCYSGEVEESDFKDIDHVFGYDKDGVLYYDAGVDEWRRSYKKGGRWIDEPIKQLPKSFEPGIRKHNKVEATQKDQ